MIFYLVFFQAWSFNKTGSNIIDYYAKTISASRRSDMVRPNLRLMLSNHIRSCAGQYAPSHIIIANKTRLEGLESCALSVMKERSRISQFVSISVMKERSRIETALCILYSWILLAFRRFLVF